jgi:hypothetical protein
MITFSSFYLCLTHILFVNKKNTKNEIASLIIWYSQMNVIQIQRSLWPVNHLQPRYWIKIPGYSWKTNMSSNDLLGSLLPSILPESNGTTDMNIERSNNPQLWDLNASVQDMYYIHRYALLFTSEDEDLAKWLIRQTKWHR